jgi:hypothetical protein
VNQTTVARINTAINDCLNQCYATDMPLATLARYLEALRTNCRWNDHEVEEVELAVLRILGQVFGIGAEPDGAAVAPPMRVEGR